MSYLTGGNPGAPLIAKGGKLFKPGTGIGRQGKGSKPKPPGSSDPYLASVVLSARFNGTLGANVLTDSSSYNHPGTVVGGNNIVISNAHNIGDGYVGNFVNNNTSYFADHAALRLGTGNFTIECFFYITNFYSGSTPAGLIAKRDLTGNYDNSYSLLVNYSGGGVLQFAEITGVGQTLRSIKTAITTGAWWYAAVTRSGNTVRGYWGQPSGTATKGLEYTTSHNFDGGAVVPAYKPLYLGNNANGAAQYLNGFMEGIRITKGVARYTSDSFLVPSPNYPIT